MKNLNRKRSSIALSNFPLITFVGQMIEMQMNTLIPITLTPKAVAEVKNIMANKGIPQDYGLRVGVKGGGGCGGATFLLGFDKKKDGDTEFNIEGITVYLEKKQTMFLIGLEVDFYEGSDARGFTFVNPDAKG